jgi:hypothetical protein
MHDMHIAHHDRCDALGQSVETGASRHRERICCNRRMQRVRHAPPNNTSAPCVHHAREVEESLVSWNVGDVAQPLLVWSVCGEVTLKEIWRRRMRVRTTALSMASLRSLRGAGNAWRNW